MLNNHDIQFMSTTVKDVLVSWGSTITIMQLLPEYLQPNFNKIMREFSGKAVYEYFVVPAERRELVNNQTNNLRPDKTEYGDKNDGDILYSIPNMIPQYNENNDYIGDMIFKPHNESIVAIDTSDDRYFITAIRERLGETLIQLERYVGDIPDGCLEIPEDKLPHNGYNV